MTHAGRGAPWDDPDPADLARPPFAPERLDALQARGSFLGVPAVPPAGVEAGSVAIVGAPFDWGASNRPGARFGPKAIRDADYLGPDGSRPSVTAGVDALRDPRVVDVGDARVYGHDVDRALGAIAARVRAVAARGAVPITLGGDHTVTWPAATGVAEAVGWGEVAVVHFDAHADTGATAFAGGHLVGHGTPMRRLIESGAVPGSRFVQVGLRGYWPPPDVLAWMRAQGMRTFWMDDVIERGIEAVVDDAVAAAIGTGAAGVYVSLDIDVVDPGSAPGTGTPEPGGLSPRELLLTVRRLGRQLHVVGADVVEVSPVYDAPSGQTALLANRLVLELCAGIAQRRAG